MPDDELAGVHRYSISGRLFAEPFAFSFFQAVRLLERLQPTRAPVGRTARPEKEAVRFRSHVSLSFPPSEIYDLERPEGEGPPTMTVNFMGLTGPSGLLPNHYTELLLRQEFEAKGPERRILRDWLDLFNHRLVSLFFRAWEKYRFTIAYERGEHLSRDPDSFTRALFSLVGLEARPLRGELHRIELSPLRNRLGISTWERAEGESRRKDLGRIDDLALLHYSGFLAQRHRGVFGLETLLQDYFQLPMSVIQFRGQWLHIEPVDQSRLGGSGSNNQLGVSLVAGARVWDAQSKFRIQIGPLRLQQFTELMPDRAPVPQRKTFYLLSHLVRLFAGPQFDFDVQLVLHAKDVPACQLGGDDPVGPRLGWNTWMRSRPAAQDAEDAVFEGEALVSVGTRPLAVS